MKILYRWLAEFVECPLPAEELAGRLTGAGLEVEGVTRLDPGPPGLVTARILSVEPHPAADRLTVCRVSDGARDYTVVCGAPNVRAGETAPFAAVGTRLPGGIAIRKAKLRGVVSEGMLCSERELGLGEDAAGILLLGPDCRAGISLAEALGLDDWLLDVNVPPNRPDCLGVIGIAREVSALLRVPLRVAPPHVAEGPEPTAARARVSVERFDLCPRYTARLVVGARPVPSPFPVRRRLALSGVRVINAIVDATNYVMLEYGQPLHAFDFARIEGGGVEARAARPGERIVTIDGRERELPGGTLVIADARGPVAVAGLMGGAGSEVGPDTAEVLLESACFDPATVRRASKALGLSSDSSYRFERGTDVEGVACALDRAAQLVAAHAGGVVSAGILECRRPTPPPRAIALRLGRAGALLSGAVTRGEAADCLTRLGFSVREGEGDVVEVVPPSFRVDARREVDLIEEIARLRGYDAVPSVAVSAVDSGADGSARHTGRARVREALRARGFSEAVTLSFMGGAEMDRLMWGESDPRRAAVRLRNPVSEEFAYLRTSLLPPLARCLGLNASRGAHDLLLFELGSVFAAAGGGAPPIEEERLALIATGLAAPASWCAPGRDADYFFVKGVLESLAGHAGLRLRAEAAPLDGFHPGRAAALRLNDEPWGILGELHPRAAEAYGIRGRVVFAEMNAAPLFAALAPAPRCRPIPPSAAVRRDIAVVAAEATPAQRLLDRLGEALPGGAVESVALFDLFTGPPIPPGRKGLAFSVRLRLPEEGGEAGIDAAVERLRAALREEGCEIR